MKRCRRRLNLIIPQGKDNDRYGEQRPIKTVCKTTRDTDNSGLPDNQRDTGGVPDKLGAVGGVPDKLGAVGGVQDKIQK